MKDCNSKIIYILLRTTTFLFYIPYPVVATWSWQYVGHIFDNRPYHIAQTVFAAVLALLTYITVYVYKREWVMLSVKTITFIDGVLFAGVFLLKNHSLHATVSSIELYTVLFTVFLCFFICDISIFLKSKKEEPPTPQIDRQGDDSSVH